MTKPIKLPRIECYRNNQYFDVKNKVINTVVIMNDYRRNTEAFENAFA